MRKKGFKLTCNHIKLRYCMSKTDKILTSKYLDWHAKLNGLPSVLTDKIQSSLYKKYKKETGYEPWQLSEVHTSEFRSPPSYKFEARKQSIIFSRAM